MVPHDEGSLADMASRTLSRLARRRPDVVALPASRSGSVRMIVSVVAVSIVAVVGLQAPADAVSGTRAHGLFWAVCYYVHSARDDPIMLPGQSGRSHLHDFFGNTSTNARSSVRTMRNAPTRCEVQGDRAGYWAPAVYLNGVRLPGQKVQAYYLNFFRHSWVHTIPFGLQMVGGNRDATSATENRHVFWSCGDVSPKVSHPYACMGRGDGHVVAGIDFPSCWDGNGTEIDDVVYPASPRTPCPSGYPIELPILSLRVLLVGVVDPCAGATPCGPWDSDANVRISLASGSYYTLHADFWNLWSPTTLQRLIRRCLDAHVKCNRLTPRPTIPAPPVLVARQASASEVHLDWTASDSGGLPITGYRIYRTGRPAAENDLGRAPLAVVGDITSFTDTGVWAGNRYYYRLVAVNRIGAGGLSNEASVKPS